MSVSTVARPETDTLRAILPGLAALGMSIALAIDLVTYKLVGYDLAAYILGARRLLSGQPLYQGDLIVLGPFGQFVYPPPVALAFVPLAVLPFDVARAAALLALVALAAGITWHLVRDLPRASRYWAAAGTVLFFPLIWEVTLENLTLVTLALCLLAWHVRRSPVLSGIGLGVAIVLKLLPLSLVLYLIAAGRARILQWAALALGVITVASWPLVAGQWPGFVSVIERIAGGPPGTGSNISPVLFSAAPLRGLLPTLALAIAVICGVVSRARDGRERHAFRVALAAAPLIAATFWYPYLVFSLPLLVSRGPRPAIASLRVPFAAARPFTWCLMQWEALSDPGREFVLPLVGLLLLISLGLAELRWGAHGGQPIATASSG